MKRTRASRSGLFLLEIIIAVTVFAIGAAVCARTFQAANTISREAQLTNSLTTEYTAIAEEVSAAEDVSQVVDFIVSRYPYCSMTKCIDETTFSVAFGKDNKPMDGTVENGSIDHVMSIHLEYPDKMVTATMTATGTDYTLTAKHYLKENK